MIDDIIYVLFRGVILEREFVTYKKKCLASTRNIRFTKISGRLLADCIDSFEHPCIFVDSRKVSSNALVAFVYNSNCGD